MNETAATPPQPQKGFLGYIERTGNKLPDPVFLFFWLIAILVVISIVASLAGLSAAHPVEIDEATGTGAMARPSSSAITHSSK